MSEILSINKYSTEDYLSKILSENKYNFEDYMSWSKTIHNKIEDEMSYPGTIKVTVIRETRAVGVAK